MDQEGADGAGGADGAEGRDQPNPEEVAFGALGAVDGTATRGAGALGRGTDTDGRLTSISLLSRYSRNAEPEIERLICRSLNDGAGREGAALGAEGRGAVSDGRL
ncbi:hypothetical protein OCUBac02_50720 (plasmid) [Bosea sp. ANAM02]|nr:hypothetical protein OCUBac02_50720 [Bosea sp. ANAM02]